MIRSNVKEECGGDMSSDFIKIMLRGAGQVMFQNNVWTGLLFLCGIFWGGCESGTTIVSWGALVGLAVSTLTGYLLGYSKSDGQEGLWGFNGVLVGCAFPVLMDHTWQMWAALVLCSAATVWVRRGMNRAMFQWNINSLTFPFVMCTWIFLLAAGAMTGMPAAHTPGPTLPESISSDSVLSLSEMAAGWLKGISQVFLIDSWAAGLLILLGLAVSNVWAALWAAAGSAAAVVVAMLFGAPTADIAGGLYGFSPVLTAVALATVFYRPAVRSAVWALTGIVFTVFVQAAMNVALEPAGIATLTAPFCITTWLFLLPLMKLDSVDAPDHSKWSRTRMPRVRKTADKDNHSRS